MIILKALHIPYIPSREIQECSGIHAKEEGVHTILDPSLELKSPENPKRGVAKSSHFSGEITWN